MKKIFFSVFIFSCIFLIGCGTASTQCFQTVSTSDQAPRHSHRWCPGQANTEDYCTPDKTCHQHPLDEKNNLAKPNGQGPHTHQLK